MCFVFVEEVLFPPWETEFGLLKRNGSLFGLGFFVLGGLVLLFWGLVELMIGYSVRYEPRFGTYINWPHSL